MVTSLVVVMADARRDIRRMASAAMRTSFSKLFDEIGTVDQVGIEERVAKFTTRSIKKSSKLWGLRTAVSMVDLTTLEGKDTPGKVASLCQKARRPSFDESVPPVAAVCIYPFLVRYAARWLADTAIKVASVATAFPSGQSPLALRLEEVKAAHPDMECVLFPSEPDRGVELLYRLRDMFGRSRLSEEDALRRESLRTAEQFRESANEGGGGTSVANSEELLVQACAAINFNVKDAAANPRSDRHGR